MTRNTETSVMFALAELQQTEILRQSEEKAREARRLQEKQEREQAERERAREAELQAQRVAEVAARLQLEVEAREAAARERVQAMQQALTQIKAERDVLHEHMQTRDSASANAPLSGMMRMAIGGVSLSLIAVAAMAVVLLTPPARARPHEITKIVYLPAPQTAVPTVAPALPPVAAAPVAKPANGAPHLKPAHRPSSTTTAGHPNPTACGDDPLCGLSFK